MKNLKPLFLDYFLAVGIVWFFCALSIIVFSLNFQIREIVLTLIIPLAFCVYRQFTKEESPAPAD